MKPHTLLERTYCTPKFNIVGNYGSGKIESGGYDSFLTTNKEDFYKYMHILLNEGKKVICEGMACPTIPMMDYFKKEKQVLVFLDIDTKTAYGRFVNRGRYKREPTPDDFDWVIKGRRRLFEKASVFKLAKCHRINVKNMTIDEVCNSVKVILSV